MGRNLDIYSELFEVDLDTVKEVENGVIVSSTIVGYLGWCLSVIGITRKEKGYTLPEGHRCWYGLLLRVRNATGSVRGRTSNV